MFCYVSFVFHTEKMETVLLCVTRTKHVAFLSLAIFCKNLFNSNLIKKHISSWISFLTLTLGAVKKKEEAMATANIKVRSVKNNFHDFKIRTSKGGKKKNVTS